MQFDRKLISQIQMLTDSRSLSLDRTMCWLGQPQGKTANVDWADLQFFIIFNFWAALFCLYILTFMAISLRRSDDIDGQMIGLAVV